MKLNRYKTIALATGLLFAISSYGQFIGKGGKTVTECDCNRKLDELDVNIQLPTSYRSYDIIGFRVMKNGRGIAYSSYYANQVSRKITLDLLNPKIEGYQTIYGEEFGLFGGEDFRKANFKTICQNGKADSELWIEVIGIKQTGTQTNYTYQGNGRIQAKTHKLYDSGTMFHETSKLVVRQQKGKDEMVLKAIGIGAGAAAIGVTLIATELFKTMKPKSTL